MNLLSSFNDFYNNLSSNGLFFFWIVVFLFIFLIFLLIVLYIKNKKLIKLLKDNKEPIYEKDKLIQEDIIVNNEKTIKEDIIVTNENKKDITVIQEDIPKNNENIDNIVTNENNTLNNKEDNNIELINNNIDNNKIKEETGPYKKNVLREMNTRGQTSPINIIKKEEDISKNVYSDDIDTTGINYGEDNTSLLESIPDVYAVNDNMRFASDIISRMEKEAKPSNIELTDYEKKQEEEAIISYDELLKVKDKIYNITEDEETDEFIDELKSFRLDLQ